MSDSVPRHEEMTSAEKQQIVDRLNASDQFEHQLAAALMGRWPAMVPMQPDDRFARLLQLHQANPDHAMTFFIMLAECGAHLDHSACDDTQLTKAAEQVDPENSEVWALIASYRVRRGQSNEALAALQRASASTATTDYSDERLLMFERAYAATSDLGLSERYLYAVGDAAAGGLYWANMVSLCNNQGASDSNWRRSCMEYGQLVERQTRTTDGAIFGLALQRDMAKMDDQAERLQQIQARIDAVYEVARFIGNVRLWNDEINLAYLQDLEVHGERGAQARLAEYFEARQERLNECLARQKSE